MPESKNQAIIDTDLPPEQMSLKYKKFWQAEQVFKDLKFTLETRPFTISGMKPSRAMSFAASWTWH